MGHAFGAAGPFCAKATCVAWGQQHIPFAHSCGSDPVYPIYDGPTSGCWK